MKKLLPKAPIDVRYILAGLFFFINPNIASLDVLPDFIGAALVIAGFLRLAEIDEKAKKAQKMLTILAFVCAGRALTLLLPDKVSGSAWSLIFTFCFGIGEAILFVYAMFMLYDGIVYQGMRCSSEKVYTGFGAFKALTVLVAALKSTLCFLPELTNLVTGYGDVDATGGGRAQTAEFTHGALLVLNVAVVTLYGIGWWIYMLRYFRTVGKAEDLMRYVAGVYDEEVANKPGVLTYRALKGAGLLFAAGLFFLLPLRLDGIDYLPDFAAGILLVLAVLYLHRVCGKAGTRALIAGGVYTLLAAGEWIYELIFFRSFVVGDGTSFYGDAPTYLLTHPEKLPLYYGLVAVSVLKYLALALLLFFICRLVPPIITGHTGSPFELSGEAGRKKSEEIRKKLFTFLTVLTVLSFAAAGAGIFYNVMRMFNDYMIIEYSETVFVLALLVAFIVFLSKLREGIDNKYYMAKD